MLDEDEFAKTLIPELFKHNNYASFVRQLNMYGFHKKVGLSDNSMKASERKNKSPSEYYNPYFRRGHPNLLWLINKPKNGNSKKKGKRSDEADGDSDEDMAEDVMLGPSFSQPTVAATRALPAPESGALSRKDLTVVRDQMATLQEQQRAIHEAISRLRREHVQLVTQARQFQDQHNRHEQSINAILSFLANVFKGKIDPNGNGGNLTINDLFSNIIPGGPQSQQSGNVVDLSDWEQQSAMGQDFTSPAKRQQRLLPPIPQDMAIKRSASASSTGTPAPYNHNQPQMGTVTELFDSPSDSTPTPSHIIEELNTNPQEGMMRLMQDVNSNATNNNNQTPVPNVSNVPAMTNDQRNRVLSLMSSHNGGAAIPVIPGLSAPPPTPAAAAPGQPSQNSLSPNIGAPFPPPSMSRISQTQDEIERLQRLQVEQSQKLDDLGSLLGPYSPSGRIPGLEEGEQYFDDNIDFGQYLDSTAYNADAMPSEFDFSTTNFDNSNLDINTDNLFGDSTGGVGRIVETHTPSHQSTSPGGTEGTPREDDENSPGRSAKRQRKD